MGEKYFKFNVEKFSLKKFDERFLHLELWLAKIGENLNGSYIDKDAYEKAKPTIEYIPICVAMNRTGTDFLEHEDSERPIGFIFDFPTNNYRYEINEEGNEYVVVDGLIFIDYCYQEAMIIDTDKIKGVSIEITIDDSYRDEEDGLLHITNFTYRSCVVLGDAYKPGMPGAHLKVIDNSKEKYTKYIQEMKFALRREKQISIPYYIQEEANKILLNKNASTIELRAIRKFAKNKNVTLDFIKNNFKYLTNDIIVNWTKELINKEVINGEMIEKFIKKEDIGKGEKIEIDNSKDNAVSGSWSNPGSKLYEPILKASNYKSLVKEAYLVVEDGYESAPSTKLKYPHHIVKDGKLVVHKDGVQAAFQRVKQQGLTGAPITHIKKHYRELGLNMENFASFGLTEEDVKFIFSKEGDEVSFNKEEFAQKFSMTANQMKDMMQEMCNGQKYMVDDYEYSKYWVSDFDNQYAYAYDYEMSNYCAIPYSVENGKINMDFDNVKKARSMTQWVITDDDDEEEDDLVVFVNKIIKDKEEKFAKEMKDKMDKEMENKMKEMENMKKEKEEMSAKFSTLEKENEELKKFKQNIEEQEKQNKIEFAIQSVVDDLTPEQIEEWRGKVVEFSNVDEFSNAIKAFAYSVAKAKQNPEKQEFSRIHIPVNTTDNKKSSSIWERL